MQTLHPSIVAWSLFEMNDPSQILHFQYNPSVLDEDIESRWKEKEVTGSPTQTLTYTGRKPNVFRFQLFLNEWGEDSSPTNNRGKNMSVEEQIAWINTRMYPGFDADRKNFVAPPILIFSWKEYVPVVIQSAKIHRTHFRSLEGSHFRGIDAGGGPPDIVGNRYLNQANNARISNIKQYLENASRPSVNPDATDEKKQLYPNTPPVRKSHGFPSPGEAIRATVDLELWEYRGSSARQIFNAEHQNAQSQFGAGFLEFFINEGKSLANGRLRNAGG